jgi:phage gp29-like protein
MIEWDGRLSDLEAGMLAAQSQYQAIIAPFLNPALTAINRHDYFNADEDWFTVYED